MTGVLTARAGRGRALVAIRVAHTAVWGFFVSCIVGMPMADAVLVECAALAANGGQCPLAPIAARFSEDVRRRRAG